MCRICIRAKASVEGLETHLELVEEELRQRDKHDPMLGEVRNNLCGQTARAWRDLSRLKHFLHGTPVPLLTPWNQEAERRDEVFTPPPWERRQDQGRMFTDTPGPEDSWDGDFPF